MSCISGKAAPRPCSSRQAITPSGATVLAPANMKTRLLPKTLCGQRRRFPTPTLGYLSSNESRFRYAIVRFTCRTDLHHAPMRHGRPGPRHFRLQVERGTILPQDHLSFRTKARLHLLGSSLADAGSQLDGHLQGGHWAGASQPKDKT